MAQAKYNLKHLRVFLQVYEKRGITAAASQVHLSQPAITQAISGLERGFGATLFTRSRAGLFPTEAGHCLYQRGTRAFDFLTNATLRGRPILGEQRARAVTTRQLLALIGVARHHSFAAAARAKGVTQPSLYRAAKELEALCETPLFGKSERGITLRPAARTLNQAASLAFVEIDAAAEDIRALDGTGRTVLRIASLPLSRGTLLPRAISLLRARHPDLNVAVTDNAYAALIAALRQGDVDMMLGSLRDPDPAPDVRQHHLFDDRLGIFCGPQHPALAADRHNLTALARYPWVVARGPTQTRLHFNALFDGLPPTTHGPAVETNSMDTARHMLAGNHMLALLSVTQAQEFVDAGAIARLTIDIGDRPRRIGVTTRKNWRPTAAQSAFMQILEEVSAAFVKT